MALLQRAGSVLFKSKVFRLPNIRMSSTNAEPLVLKERRGKIFLVGINRPHKRNCVNVPTAHALYDAFKEFENDDSLRVAVFYGNGGTFCAGYDLSELSGYDKKEVDGVPAVTELREDQGPMGPSRMFLSKPLIGAVSGYAVAGGLELSLLCDLRVAETNAVFGVFCRRFGVPLLDGGTVRLPHIVGLGRAQDMILTGRPVGAEEALQMGLANRIVSVGTALEASIKLAESIAEFPQECAKRDRLSAFYSCYEAKSMKDALEFEHNNAIHVVAQESIKGAQRFVSGVGKSGSFDLKPKPKL